MICAPCVPLYVLRVLRMCACVCACRAAEAEALLLRVVELQCRGGQRVSCGGATSAATSTADVEGSLQAMSLLADCLDQMVGGGSLHLIWMIWMRSGCDLDAIWRPALPCLQWWIRNVIWTSRHNLTAALGPSAVAGAVAPPPVRPSLWYGWAAVHCH